MKNYIIEISPDDGYVAVRYPEAESAAENEADRTIFYGQGFDNIIDALYHAGEALERQRVSSD